MRGIVKLAANTMGLPKTMALQQHRNNMINNHLTFLNFAAKRKAEALQELSEMFSKHKTFSRTPENAKAFDAAMLKYKNDMSDLARLGNHLANKGRIDKTHLSRKDSLHHHGHYLDWTNNAHLMRSGQFETREVAEKFRRASDLSAALRSQGRHDLANKVYERFYM
jgi:hypothetical protein